MEIRRGTVIEHKEFGRGVVLEVHHHPKIVIRFKDGTKKLDITIAKEVIKVVGEEEVPYEKTAFEKLLEKTPTSKRKRKKL